MGKFYSLVVFVAFSFSSFGEEQRIKMGQFYGKATTDRGRNLLCLVKNPMEFTECDDDKGEMLSLSDGKYVLIRKEPLVVPPEVSEIEVASPVSIPTPSTDSSQDIQCSMKFPSAKLARIINPGEEFIIVKMGPTLATAWVQDASQLVFSEVTLSIRSKATSSIYEVTCKYLSPHAEDIESLLARLQKSKEFSANSPF